MESDSDTTMYSAEEESLSDSEKQYFYKVDDCIIYKEDLRKLINSSNPEKKAILNSLVTSIIEKHERHEFKILVTHGYKVEAMDASGQTALHLAFYKSYYHLLSNDRGKMIFECAGEKNYVDKFGLSHFHIACDLGNLPVVEKYLKRKVDINAYYHNEKDNEKDGTPLHFAIHSHRLKVVQLLIENGADVNARDSKGRTCLHLAAITNDYPELSCWEDDLNIIKIFAANSDFINSKDNYHETPIQEIFCTTYYTQVDILYSELNDDGTTIETKKHITVNPKTRQKEKLELLLELGADVTVKDSRNHTVFHQVVEDLESMRCPGDFIVSFDDTLHTDLVKHILAVGQNIDINEKNSNGDSPLQIAMSSMSFDMVKLLLDHGADISNLKFAERTKMTINYPMIFPTFECVKNVFAIIELMADKGFNLNDEDNLVFLKLFLHNSEKDCSCSDAIEMSGELISGNEILSFSMPNHLEWIWNMTEEELIFYLKDIQYGQLYIATETEALISSFLQEFYQSALKANFVPDIKEIDYMKAISLRKNVSLHDILKMHPYTIYPYIADNDFNFLQKFSRYKHFIKGHLTKSLIRHYFEKSAYKYLEMFLTSLEYPCLRIIISYLSNEDIWAVSQAVVLGESYE